MEYIETTMVVWVMCAAVQFVFGLLNCRIHPHDEEIKEEEWQHNTISFRLWLSAKWYYVAAFVLSTATWWGYFFAKNIDFFLECLFEGEVLYALAFIIMVAVFWIATAALFVLIPVMGEAYRLSRWHYKRYRRGGSS